MRDLTNSQGLQDEGNEGDTAKPLFSVIVATRNRPAQLARCIEALKRLEPPTDGFEVVLVDDGSEPPISVPLWGLKGVVLRREGDGPATARNTGASRALGRYLVFLDDDCEPQPDWLRAFEGQVGTESPRCLGGYVENAQKSNVCAEASQLLLDYIYGIFEDTSEQFYCSNNLCLPTGEFRALGGFDSSFPLPAAEDRDLCIRWREAGYSMGFVRSAVVMHSHPMGFVEYWRQHFRYGRGAYQFHLLRATRTGQELKVEPVRFYWNLVCFPFKRQSFPRALLTCFLLLVSQLSNALGFFYERFRRRAEAEEGIAVKHAQVGGKE